MSTMVSNRAVRAVLLAVSALLVGVPAASARPRDGEPEFLPPAPRDRSPVRGVETRVYMPMPAYTRPLCPTGAACIVGVGGGFGVFVDRRFQSGFSLGVGYELFFLSAEAIYELTTQQALGFRAQWTLRPERAGHPTLSVGAGAVSIEDVFRPKTVGIYGTVGAGGELEMSESLAFTCGIDFRLAAYVPFTSQPDGVDRSISPFLTVTPVLRVGILWLAPRARSR